MRGNVAGAERQMRLPLAQLLAAAGPPRDKPRLTDLLRARPLRPRPKVLYFASGSNAAGEVRGFAAVGHPVGVSAPDCRGACEKAILALAGTGVPVFVDNGAIAEKKTGIPITDEEWTRRLGLYLRLARAMGPQLHLVAPDKVGDPKGTVRRWQRYAPFMRELVQLGAQVLVPLQCGNGVSLFDMEQEARRVLMGGRPHPSYVPAIPARKGVTPIAEIRRFLLASRPARVHFLGLGPSAKGAGPVLDALAEIVPSADVRMDSVLLRGHVGRDTKVPRKLTRAIDEIGEDLREHHWGEAPSEIVDADGGGMPDYTEMIHDPDQWLAPKERERVAKQAGLSALQAAAFVRAPSDFLHSAYDEEEGPLGVRVPDDAEGDLVRWYEMPWLEAALDQAWSRYRYRLESHARKERAIRKVYGGSR